MLCDCCQQDYPVLNDLLGYCDDCSELINACEDALEIARRIGVSHYGPSSWRDVSVQEHLEHASRHIYSVRKATDLNLLEPQGYVKEDHLAHAICRLVMVKALTDDS